MGVDNYIVDPAGRALVNKTIVNSVPKKKFKFSPGDIVIVIIFDCGSIYNRVIRHDFHGKKMEVIEVHATIPDYEYKCRLIKDNSASFQKMFGVISERFLFREDELTTDLLLLL